MRNTTTFRLKDKKKKGTYTLKRALAKIDGVQKYISYRPGASSIVDDDNKGSAARTKWVVFKFNNHKNDPAVELEVPKSNPLLLEFVKKHPRYGIDYEIYDKDAAAQKEIDFYDNVEKALRYIGDGDDNEVRAAALAVFGFGYFTETIPICRKDLKEKAHREPKVILNVYQAKDFHNRYLASLLYCTGVIKNNGTQTSILWSDTENAILTIAKGESGIDKLTEFLAAGTQESQTLMQEFQSRVERVGKKEKIDEKAIAAKDAEIAKLRAQLEAATKKPEDIKVKEPETETGNTDLSEAQAAYKAKFNNEVPVRYKNDLEWIKGKIVE